ncbi:PIN domain-containing protein [Pseudonocardia spinosispora]|uniref:PIN domain-containing protein n=1 Tax=Pseudonocardia spinosispora TaxID=103441 RepID=UPI00048E3C6A|nr:PIN domain-containing protein [Pseudonocardia spinosispora]
MTGGLALPDTSVWIQPPAKGLAAYAKELAISMITVAELQYGATVPDQLQSLARRRRLQIILDNYAVLPLDLPTAELYGVLASMVRQYGHNPRPRRLDLLIAATAARHQMTLLTRDKSGFTGLEAAVHVVQVD